MTAGMWRDASRASGLGAGLKRNPFNCDKSHRAIREFLFNTPNMCTWCELPRFLRRNDTKDFELAVTKLASRYRTPYFDSLIQQSDENTSPCVHVAL